MPRFACLVALILLANAPAPALAQQSIGALGRIEPKDGVIRLVGPAGEVVEQILVKEGAEVRRGQALATFSGKPLREAELALAQLDLREAEEMRAKGLALKENEVKVAKAELELSQNSFANMDRVGAGSFSALQVDQRKNQVHTAQLRFNSATLELERARQESAIRLERARERVKLCQEKLALATLSAPGEGTVLEIRKNPGETCGGEPLLLMADLNVMYVSADIFEADLPLLKLGQEATVTSKALGKTVAGRVESIGRLISPQTKVAKVLVRLDQAEPASRLINSEVNVSFKTAR